LSAFFDSDDYKKRIQPVEENYLSIKTAASLEVIKRTPGVPARERAQAVRRILRDVRSANPSSSLFDGQIKVNGATIN